jgi:hypothetical protein
MMSSTNNDTRNGADAAFVIIPDYGPYPYSALQIFGFAILGFFPTLSLVVVGLRVYSRRLMGGLALGKSHLAAPHPRTVRDFEI